MRAWVAFLLVPLAGCTASVEEDGCAIVPPVVYGDWGSDHGHLEGPWEEGVPWQTVIAVAPGNATAPLYWDPAFADNITTAWADESRRLQVVTVTLADAGDDYALSLFIRADAPAGCEDPIVASVYSYGHAQDVETASPGTGVHVWYAGFWTNGTLFDTNLETVHDSDWPRAAWYDAAVGAPLPVYVYDQARTERPAYWGPLRDAPPVTDTPVDDTWDANVADIDSTFGLGYYTTIEGFNEALKGLSTGTTKVVVIPPEKAYTRPGNEAHVLYGDAIVFWIWAEEVVTLPCNSPGTTPAPIVSAARVPCDAPA